MSISAACLFVVKWRQKCKPLWKSKAFYAFLPSEIPPAFSCPVNMSVMCTTERDALHYKDRKKDHMK